MYKQNRVGDYIITYTGKKFYPLDPKPEDISIIDIAHSLSGLPRFTAHSERFYTVAEHSIHCAWLAKKLELPTLIQLYALLHDASECITNDIARPLKQNLEEVKKIEHNIMSTIWKTCGLPEPTEDDYKIIKNIDNAMLANEMCQLMPKKYHDYHVDECDDMYVDLSIEYLRNEVKGMFLMSFAQLMEEYEEEMNNKELYNNVRK